MSVEPKYVLNEAGLPVPEKKGTVKNAEKTELNADGLPVPVKKKEATGEVGGGTPKDLPAGGGSGTTSTTPTTVKWEDNPLNPVKAAGEYKEPEKSKDIIDIGLTGFMRTPVADIAAKVKNKMLAGRNIDKSELDFIQLNDYKTYTEITKELSNKFVAKFKQETGQDYTPDAVDNLKASQRIKLGIAKPGDADQAITELVQEDLETNFPIKPKNIFEPFSQTEEEQVKWYNEIMTNPEKKAEYLLKRQQQEIEKEAKLIPYQDRYSTESMSIGDAGFASDNPLPTLQERGKKISELNTLRGKIDNLKKIAASAITPVEMDRLVKENGIQDINSKEAIDFLASKKGREKLGLRVALKSDARLAAQLSDIQTSLQESQYYKEISQNKIPATILPTDEESNFKNLSETGDEKIQAQLRMKGYNDMVSYYNQNGNTEAVKKLLEKQNEVAVENGKAVSDELFARLSVARFKDNDKSTTIGTWDITPENMRKWATQSGFTPVEMDILEQHMIPDENSRSITSNLQTSGFVDNLFEAVGNTAINMKNLFRSDASRTREMLNENAGRKEDIGQYTPFLQELKAIAEKEKTGTLTPQEQSRKELLLDNSNLLNWWQQFKSGTGDLTGQVVGLALSAKGIDKIFKLAALARATQAVVATEGTAATAVGEFEAASTGIANNISNSPSFLQNVAKYVKDNRTLYISSYTNAYDGYKKESLQLMPGPENEGKRLLYSNMMSTFEAVSEKIFDDRKVLNSLGAEIKPVIREIVEDISKGALDKAAAIGKLQSILLGGDYKKFGVNFLKGSNQEGIEEGVVDLFGDLSKAIVLDQNYDLFSSAGGALKTYGTMVLNGGLVAGMGAKSDTRNSTFNKSTLYNMAANPVEYKDEVNRLLLSGEINQQEANEKIAIINKAEQAYSAMVKDGVIDKTGKNDAKNAAYLLHTVNQAVNKLWFANNTEDDIVKTKYTKQAERSKAIRENIYTGLVSVDEFLNPVTTDEKLAEKLDIELITPAESNQTGVTSAVIEIGGKVYEGKNHAEAILKAKAEGKDISKVDRKRQGKFKLADGTVIDRAQAKKQFGADRAEQLIEQDEAADNANKEYRKSDKDLVNEVEEKGVPGYEKTSITELKEQALQAPASFKNQFDDEELTVNLIAKNTPEQIENAIKYQEERLTNDPNMDEVSITGIDQHIQLLEKGLEKNKQFAVKDALDNITESDFDKLTPSEKVALYKEHGITKNDGSEITEKDIENNPLQYSYDFSASSNSGKWNSANGELESAVQGHRKAYSLYKMLIGDNFAGDENTFKEIVDYINGKTDANIEYTDRMRRADEMTPEERQSAVDSYNKSAEGITGDKSQKEKDILDEHGFTDGKEYSPEEFIEKFPLKGVQKIIWDIIKPIVNKLGIKVKFSSTGLTEGFDGSNNPLTGEILIRPSTLKNGRFGEVLVHELVHSLTTKIISRVNSGVETGLTEKQVSAVKGLNKLYESVKGDNNLQNKYPVKDIFEFIAHLTNDSFVKELESKDRNFIQKVVDFISEILGLSNANELAKKYLKDIIHDGTFLEKEGVTVVSSDYAANVKGAEGLSPKQQLLEAIKKNSKQISDKYNSEKDNKSDASKALENLLKYKQSAKAQVVSEQGKPLSKLENLKAKKKLAEVEVPGETVDEKLKHIADKPEGFAPELVALAEKRFPIELSTETPKEQSGKDVIPLTKEAEDLLASIGEGSKPTFITKNLEKIANDNGIEVTGKMSADDVINALKEKQQTGKDVVVDEVVVVDNPSLKDVESTKSALEENMSNGQMGKILNKEGVRDIPVSDIVENPNDKSFEDAIRKVKQGLGSRTKEPIIVVLKNDGKYHIRDGTHRVAEAMVNGDKNISADVEYDVELNQSKNLAEAYHKAKLDGSNPELVKAVEQSLSTKPEPEIKNEEAKPVKKVSAIEKIKEKREKLNNSKTKNDATEIGQQPKSDKQQRKGTAKQQQGKQTDRADKEENVTPSQEEASSGNLTEQGREEKIAELEKEKQQKINEVTKPDVDFYMGIDNVDLANTTAANRHQLLDIKSRLQSLNQIIKCLWS